MKGEKTFANYICGRGLIPRISKKKKKIQKLNNPNPNQQMG